MVIAVEENLDEISALLTQKSHQVVSLYGYAGAVDAVVYHSESISSLTLSSNHYGNSGSGVLMICAKNLSPEQVLNIVEKRNYGESNILEF